MKYFLNITSDDGDNSLRYSMIVDGKEYMNRLRSMMNHPSFNNKDMSKIVTLELFEGKTDSEAVVIDTLEVPYSLYDSFFIDK